MIKFNNERGMILIVSFIVIVSLTLLSSVFLIIALNEKSLANKAYYDKQAFWLAEAGLERARNTDASGWNASPTAGEMSIGPLSDSEGIGEYQVIRTQPVSTIDRYIYESWAAIPSLASTDKRGEVKIEQVIEFLSYNIGEFAISSQGSLDVKGNATVNGDVLAAGSVTVGGSGEINGDVLDETSFIATFENIFGKTEADLLAMPPDNTYTDPPNNQGGVSGLTWIDFSADDTFRITTPDWTGSGILIIDEGNLEMTGGTFNGIIWVQGTLKVSGNTAINGTIFVESGAEVDTSITGTPTINYDRDQVEAALGSIGATFPTTTIDMGYDIISWKEL